MDQFYKTKSTKNHLCTSGIIVRDKKVLLGHRAYHNVSAWISPGGRCDEGESPETAVLREVREEIGVTDAKIVRRLGEKEGAYADEKGKDRVIVYEITTGQEPRLMEPEKFKEWKWFGIDELPESLLGSKDREFFIQAIETL